MIRKKKNKSYKRQNSTTIWLKNNKLHREDGPAVNYLSGYKAWYRNNKLHREDGPAQEYPNGFVLWYRNGKLHREDGPAIEYADGTKEWWLNGEQVDPLTHTMLVNEYISGEKI